MGIRACLRWGIINLRRIYHEHRIVEPSVRDTPRTEEDNHGGHGEKGTERVSLLRHYLYYIRNLFRIYSVTQHLHWKFPNIRLKDYNKNV